MSETTTSPNPGGLTDDMLAPLIDLSKRLLNGDQTVVVDALIRYIVPASMSLLAVFVGYLAAKFLARVISGPICKRIDETLGRFIGRVVFYGVLASVLVMVLNVVGFRMSGLATILAAAGFAIGLAFQGTLSNFAAGVLLLVFRPFKVGDMINAAGMTGIVNEIDLFTTTLDTTDNRRIIVPNSAISSGTIENISFHKHRRVEVIVGVSYSADLDATRTALTTAATSLDAQMIQGPDRGFTVILAGMADSSVQWKVRVWAATTEFWPVTEKLNHAIKRQLDAAQISIPFPQMDVHLHRVDRAEAGGTEARGVNSDGVEASPTMTRNRPRLSILARELRGEQALADRKAA